MIRKNTLTISISAQDEAEIKRRAKDLKMSASAYVREKVLDNSSAGDQQEADKVDRVPLEVRLDELTKKVQAMEEQNTNLYSVIAEYITRTDEQIYEQSHFVARFIQLLLTSQYSEEEAEKYMRGCEKEAKRDLERYKAAMMEGD